MPIPKRIVEQKPQRVPVKPQRIGGGTITGRITPPYTGKVIMPDGARGVVHGDNWKDAMVQADDIGAQFYIDQLGHKWEITENGKFISVGMAPKKIPQ